MRVYSISSTPTRPHNIQVTVKRVPGGIVSNWLNDEMRPGMAVEIADIGGQFNYLDIPSRKPLFLSGGSGVTPVISMLQYITDVAEPTDVIFVHFARTPQDIIFRDQLTFLAKRFRNIAVHFVVGDAAGEPGFTGHVGRISPQLIREIVPDLSERDIFMCGPEGFMSAARGVLAETPVNALHEESYGERIEIDQSRSLGGEVYFALSGRQGPVCPAKRCWKRR